MTAHEPSIITGPDGRRYAVRFFRADDGAWTTTVGIADTGDRCLRLSSYDEDEGRRLHWWMTTLILRGSARWWPRSRFGWRGKLNTVRRILTFRPTKQEQLMEGAIASGVFRDETVRRLKGKAKDV